MAWMRTPLAALLALALSAPALSAPAWGQTIDSQKAQAWLEQTFGITSERVVEATPDALVVLRSVEARPPSDFRVMVHVEDFRGGDPLTPPSSDEEYFINCPSRRFHVERIETFSQNGGRGSQSTTFGPTTWGRPIPNSSEERIVSAVCGSAVAQAPVAAEPPAAAPSRPPPPQPEPAVQEQEPPPVQVVGPVQPRTPHAPAKAGPARAQLFAGDDRASAQRFMEALPARLPAASGGRKPEIVQASSGGRPVYRVQVAGFASGADAARFCSALRATGLDCFVPPGR